MLVYEFTPCQPRPKNTRDQAKIAFWTAQQMARRSPDFLKSHGVEVLAHRIVQARSASYFEAVSADADSSKARTCTSA